MTATYQPLSVPRRDETARLAIARADGRQPRGRRVVRYEGETKIRRGRLEVTLLDAVKWPLRWQGEATG